MDRTHQQNGPECYPQGYHEMDSCREEEKRMAQSDMEKISEKRNDGGWMDLDPESKAVI